MSAAAEDLHRVIDSIREKYLRAKDARLSRDSENAKFFKPITERLDRIRSAEDLQKDVKVEEDGGGDSKPKKQKMKKPESRYANGEEELGKSYRISYTSQRGDSTYGLYRRSGQWYLGDDKVRFDGDMMKIRNNTFRGTKGLYELLFRKDPRNYTQDDLKTYREMLELTNAHYYENDPSTGKYKDADNVKMNIVEHLFDTLGTKSGRGLNKIEDGRRISYAYWDDPNELVDRLRLLTASQRAGNDSHDNEIVSILAELEEAGFIE